MKWIPGSMLDTGTNIIKHICSIPDALDLSKQLSKKEIKTLGMGPKFIPKDNKTLQQMFENNIRLWEGERFRHTKINKYRPEELTHINNTRTIRRRKGVIIKKADKGNCLIAMTIEQYRLMGENYLQKAAYGTIDEQKLLESEEDIAQLVEVIRGRHPDFYARHRKLFESKPFRDRYIYFLPKIHKPMQNGMYKGRPITDTFGTYGITLDKIFAIYANRLRHTIKTTTMGSLETVIKLEQFSQRGFNKNWVFLTFDIEDLYTNIPICEALEIVQRAMCKEKILDKPVAHLLTTIIKTLFTNNKINFGQRKVLQKNGIGMGWHSAPIIADLYVYHTIEKDTIIRANIGNGFYNRLLDDGLAILPAKRMADKLLTVMQRANPTMKYTHEIGRTANFLDIFLKFKEHRLIRGVYTKPTSNLSVIHAKSDHPYGTKMSVIRARFLWFLRCSSGTQEFISITHNFISKLQRIGYDADKMWEIAKNTYSISKNQRWPYIKNPSPRIAGLLGIEVQHNDHERIKYKRMEWSRNLKEVNRMMSLSSRHKPAYAFGRNLVSHLTNSNHDKQRSSGTQEQAGATLNLKK